MNEFQYKLYLNAISDIKYKTLNLFNLSVLFIVLNIT